MSRLGAQAKDADTLLRLGQVLAWRAGLAHYRESALNIADALPEPLALAAVGATGTWAEVRARLRADPWFDPSCAARSVHVAACIGGFRGFGGLFSLPPRVHRSFDFLIAVAGNDGFLVTADAFGATFHRASADELAAARTQSELPSGVHVRDEQILYRERLVEAPTCGKISSVASLGRTLAITSTLTHSIVLVSLGEES
jgi:hypothetical protein